jgi:hypothetical protein
MKLNKYLMVALATISAVTTTVSCSDVDEVTLLDEVQVSSSYVTFEEKGSSTTIEVNATDSWSFVQNSIPDWFSITPTSGGPGKTSVTFSAGPATDTQETTILLECAGKTQRIIVKQYATEKEPTIFTVNEAVSMIKAGTQGDKPVYVRGIVCRIQEISPSYGNATYFLSDDGSFKADNWLEVYRGYWLNGEKFTTGDEFSVGDEMVIKGVLIDYNGTPETNQGTCEVVSITKSLIKCDSTYVAGVNSNELPVEGGEIKAYLTNKANGVNVNIPDDAKSWLSVSGIDINGTTNVITLQVAPNSGGDRSTTISFMTSDGKKTYTAEQTIAQKGAILEVPVSDFLAAAEDDTQYRVTGIITSLYESDKQGKSFYLRDYSGEVLIYRAEGFIEAGAKVGDIVTVVGKRTSYKETPQMGTVTFEELKYPVTPVSIADFIAKEDSKEVYYMISGTVGPSVGDGTKYDLEQYGNFNLTDETGSVYIYGVTDGWGGAKGTFSNLGIVEGDKITIVAYKTSYKGLVEGVGMFFSKEVAE